MPQPNAVPERNEADTLPEMQQEAAGSERARRFRVRVGKPQAQLVLGQPDEDVGFPGITLHTTEHYLVDVERTASWHLAGDALVQYQARAYVTAAEYAVNAGTDATYASGARLVLVAGGGYPDREAPARVGALPEGLTYDPGAVSEVLDPVRKASALWAEASHGRLTQTAKERLGVTRQHGFRSVAPHLDRLVPGAWLGSVGKTLQKVGRVLGKLERKVARPGQSVGRIEKVEVELARVKEQYAQARDELDRCTQAAGEVSQRLGPTASALWRREFRVVSERWATKESEAPAKPRERGATRAPNRRRWAVRTRSLRKGTEAERRGREEDALARLLVSARTLTRSVRALVQSANAIGSQLAGLAGFGDQPRKVLGLAAKDGLTMATSGNLLGVAHGGFYFEAPAKQPKPDGLLAKLGAFFKSAPKSKAEGTVAAGDFVVRVAGELNAVAEGDVSLLAPGDEGTAVLAATRSTEVLGADAAALRATKGTAEVAGKHVVIGYDSDLQRPDRAEASAVLVARLQKLGERAQELTAELAKAEASLKKTKAALVAARVAAAGELASRVDTERLASGTGLTKPGSSKLQKGAQWTVKKLEEALFELEGERATLVDQLERTQRRVKNINASSSAISPPQAAVLGAQAIAAQAPTESVLVAAKKLLAALSRGGLELYGKTIALGRSETLLGKVAEQVAIEGKTVAIRGKSVHIEADTELTMKVKNASVEMSAKSVRVKRGNVVIELTDAGAKVQAGGTEVDVRTASLLMNAPRIILKE